MYRKAWELLLKNIEKKTSWGRNEIKQEMLECLIKAGEENEKA
jgi:hypothetical protein